MWCSLFLLGGDDVTQMCGIYWKFPKPSRKSDFCDLGKWEHIFFSHTRYLEVSSFWLWFSSSMMLELRVNLSLTVLVFSSWFQSDFCSIYHHIFAQDSIKWGDCQKPPTYTLSYQEIKSSPTCSSRNLLQGLGYSKVRTGLSLHLGVTLKCGYKGRK